VSRPASFAGFDGFAGFGGLRPELLQTTVTTVTRPGFVPDRVGISSKSGLDTLVLSVSVSFGTPMSGRRAGYKVTEVTRNSGNFSGFALAETFGPER
jgi:hypothetical protein